MRTSLKTEFVNEDRSLNTEKAIEAGHDARTAAIKEFAVRLSSAIKALAFRGETQRI